MSTQEVVDLLLLEQDSRLGEETLKRREPVKVVVPAGRPALQAKLQEAGNPADAYLSTLPSPKSRSAMRAALARIARLFGKEPEGFAWESLRWQHIHGIRSRLLSEGKAPAYVNLHLAALKGACKAAWHMGLMPHEQCWLIQEIQNVKGESPRAGRMVQRSELLAVLETCVGVKGARDAAAIAVLYAGLRRSEASALRLEDWDRAECRLFVRGKGRRARTAYAFGTGAFLLERWAELRGGWQGPLLCPVTCGGRVLRRRLAPETIYLALRERCRESEVKPFSPHDLRRTCITEMLDAGKDLALVAKAIGHASPVTTARYDRRPERARRGAFEGIAL